MESTLVRNILEASLLVAGKPMSVTQLDALFEDDIDRPDKATIRNALKALAESYDGRGIELVEVAGGWRLQTRSDMQHWIARLFSERPPRYSRALLETLVLIAYRQPITRGEIEDVRGVAVSSSIVKTLQEREWVREVGHKDVPGRPALLGTTSAFLDYFNLKRLEDLPAMGDLRDIEQIEEVLAAELGIVPEVDEPAANDGAERGSDDSGSDDSEDEVESSSDESVDSECIEPDKVASNVIPFGGVGAAMSSDADASDKPLSMSDIAGRFADHAESDQEMDPSTDSSDAQTRLLDTVNEYAAEHRREIEARDEHERAYDAVQSSEPAAPDTAAGGDGDAPPDAHGSDIP